MTVYKDDMGQRDTPQSGFSYLNCYSGKYQEPQGWVGLWNAQQANVGFESWKQPCGRWFQISVKLSYQSYFNLLHRGTEKKTVISKHCNCNWKKKSINCENKT